MNVTYRACPCGAVLISIGAMDNDIKRNEKFLLAFGKNMALVRKNLRWSQERLALESGVARSYLSGVERGQRNIAVINIYRIARTLNISPAVFFDFKYPGLND